MEETDTGMYCISFFQNRVFVGSTKYPDYVDIVNLSPSVDKYFLYLSQGH